MTIFIAIGAGWAPAAPASAAAGARLDPAERAIVRAVNRTRDRHGLAPVRAHRGLQRAADAHCRDMLRADFFAHSSSDGTPMSTRVSRYERAPRLGETLAYTKRGGRRAARRVVAGWMRSPAHRAAMLSAGFDRLGVARRRGGLGSRRVTVYTADFAGSR